MADIAVIAHWPLSDMDELDLGELIAWHQRFVERWSIINGEPHQ